MPLITSIKFQENQKRINVYLDNEFGFGLDLENYVKLGLKVEQVLTDEEVKKIIKEGEFQKVYDKILRFGSLRPRSEKEYKGWLTKHKVSQRFRQELFNRLKRLDFVNDRKFAAWWVDQRQNFRPKSKRILNIELRLKGIGKETIEEVLGEAKIDELAVAKNTLEKKKYKWEKLDDFEARRRKANFLAGKGFSWEIIKKVVEVDQDE